VWDFTLQLHSFLINLFISSQLQLVVLETDLCAGSHLGIAVHQPHRLLLLEDIASDPDPDTDLDPTSLAPSFKRHTQPRLLPSQN